jgi:hypothetical protein
MILIVERVLLVLVLIVLVKDKLKNCLTLYYAKRHSSNFKYIEYKLL